MLEMFMWSLMKRSESEHLIQDSKIHMIIVT